MNTPLTSEEIVNSFVVGDQNRSAIATLTSGDYVIVWTSAGQDGDQDAIVGQRFSAQGERLGVEFIVNELQVGDQQLPAIAATDDGGFVVVWESGDSSSLGVKGRQFDAAGDPAGGEFQVNVEEAGTQNSPTVTGIPGGGFAVAWYSQFVGGAVLDNVMMRVFDGAGAPQTGDVTVNVTGAASSSSEYEPALARIEPSGGANGLAAGGFVAAYRAADGSGSGIALRIFDPTGTPIGSEVFANTTTVGTQYDAAVTGLTGGRFVVTWTGPDGSSDGIFAQVFEGDGTPVGSEFQVNVQTSSIQFESDVVATSDGGFAVVWTALTSGGSGDGNGYGIISRRFDQDGTALTGETIVNEQIAQHQTQPAAAPLANGDFVVSWTSGSQGASGDGSADAVVQRLMGDPLGFMPSSASPIVNAVSATRTFAESVVNGAPQRIDADGAAAVSDADSSDFNGGRLTVGVIAQSVPDDEFLLQDNRGQDLLGLDTSGVVSVNAGTGAVSVSGIQVGTISSDGADGRNLVIDLNANADATAVEVLVENLTYQNLSDDPRPVTRVAIQLEDGDGGSAAPALVDITIIEDLDRDGPLGSETRVNSVTADFQNAPAAAGLLDGGYIAVWQSRNQDNPGDNNYGVFAQRYDANGVASGAEFQVNSTIVSSQASPSVAGLEDGGWVVVWEDASDGSIRLDRYDAAGTRTVTELQVETNSSSTQGNPVVTALVGGGYVVTWHSFGASGDGNSYGVKAQLYNALGATVGGEILVNQQTVGTQYYPAVSALNAGRFVVVWEESDVANGDGSGSSVAARIFDAAGVAEGNEFRVNTTVANAQNNQQVATLSNGDFIVAWRSEAQDLSSGGIYYRRFDATGAALGTEVRVNETTPGNQTVPDLIALDNGGFVISWVDTSTPAPGSGSDVFAQVFDADGTRLDSEIRVNTEVSSTQDQVAMAPLPNGNYVVLWTSANSAPAGDGSSDGVFQQIFGDPSEISSSAAPVISGLPGSVSFTEDAATAGALLLASGAVLITDADSADFDGGQFMLTRVVADPNADDYNAPDDNTQDNVQVVAAGPVTLSNGGTRVNVNGVAVADITSDGQMGAPLVLSFLPGATVARVQDVLSAITYQNPSDDAAGQRTYQLTLRDGDGGQNVNTVLDVTVTGVDELGVPEAAGTETRVNSFTSGNQNGADLAVLNDGGWVSVWVSATQDNDASPGIYLQRYAADGSRASGEIRVNTTEGNTQTLPAVTALGNGGWVVAWSGDGVGDANGVFTQRFDATGAPVGSETLVNGATNFNQDDPAVASLNTGGYVVSWTSNGQDGSGQGVFFTVFDVNGVAQTGEIQANTEFLSTQYTSDVAALVDGRIVVTWASQTSGSAGDGSGYGVFARIFNPDGTQSVAEFGVNSTTTGNQLTPSVGATADGGFVIAWEDQGGQDGSGSGVVAQRFDAAAVAQDGEFVVNDQRSSSQDSPDVVGLSDGRFLITYTDRFGGVDGSGGAVLGQLFTATGQRIDGSFIINSQTSGSQTEVRAAALANGAFVANWQSQTSGSAGDGSGDGVFQQIFGDPANFNLSGAPVVVGLSQTVDIAESAANAGLVRLDLNKTVAHGDLDSADFDTGILRLAVDSSPYLLSQLGPDGTAQDQLGLLSGDVGNGDVQISGTGVGATVSVDGTAVGTIIADGVNGADFAVQFNAQSSVEAIEAILGNLAYGNDSDGPSPSRRLKLDLSDGDGQSAESRFVTVNVLEDIDSTLVGGAERRANAHTDNEQTNPDVVELTGGGFVAIWESRYQDNRVNETAAGIFGQLYDANQMPVGPEFRVNTVLGSDQSAPQVAATDDGGFVVVYEDWSGADGSGVGVLGQRFNADGSLNGTEFVVNLTTSSTQYQPSVAALAGGGFVVSYSTIGVDGSGYGIVTRSFDAAGVGALAEVQVNVANTSGNQLVSQVAALVQGTGPTPGASAGHVVVFEAPTSGGHGDGSGSGIFARVFDAGGAAIGADFLVNTVTAGSQYEPHVAALTGGGFVVAWTDPSLDGNSTGIFAQRYDNSGVAQGTAFRVNTTTISTQIEPEVTALADGGFAIGWTDYSGQDGSGAGVFLQRYDAAGLRIDGETRVNVEFSSTQDQLALGALGSGLIAAWRSVTSASAGDGSGSGIFLRSFESAPPADTAPDLSSFDRTVTLFANDITTAPVVLDDDVVFSDPDSATFNGGVISVYYTTPNSAFDQLTLDTSGAVSITNGNEVRVGGVQIGTIDATDDGANGAGLTIALNGASDAPGVEAVLEALAFSSTDLAANLPGTSRGIGFLVTDGTGGQTEPDSVLVTIQSGSFSGTGTGLSDFGNIENGQQPQFDPVSESALIAAPLVLDRDVDLDDFAGVGFANGQLRIDEVYSGIAAIQLSVEDQGSGTGQIGFDSLTGTVSFEGTAIGTVNASFNGLSSSTLQIDFNGSATAAAVEALIEALTLKLSGSVNTAQLAFDVSVTNQNGVTNTFPRAVLPVERDSVVTLPGDDTQVNTYTQSTQNAPRTAALSDGGYMVVWQSAGQDNPASSNRGIFAQRYDAQGHEVGVEFQVNDQPLGDQYQPRVTGLPNGNYVVLWSDSSGRDGSGTGVYGQILQNDGTRVGGAFLVNEEINSIQDSAQAVALDAGRFMTIWRSQTSGTAGDGSGLGIFGRVFDATGTPEGSEFQINTTTVSTQQRPRAVTLADGDVMVVWEDHSGADGSSVGSFAQRIDDTGTLVDFDGSALAPGGSGETQLNTTTLNSQDRPDIAALGASGTLPSGGFVAVWESDDGHGDGIWAQIYDINGVPQGGEFLVNVQQQFTQSDPVVVGRANGGFTVAWSDDNGTDGSGYGVIAQSFFADGSTDGPSFVVNARTSSTQYQPELTELLNGTLVSVWTSTTSGTAGDGSVEGVFQRLFDAPPLPAGAMSPALEGLASAVTFAESDVNAGLQLLDQDGALSLADMDSANFDTGVLVVARVVGAASVYQQQIGGTLGLSQDQLGIVAGNGVSVAGSTVSVNAVAIGTIDAVRDGVDGADLAITFNANATPERVEAVLAQLGYANTSDGPAQTRLYALNLSDGDGGSTGNQLIQVDVTEEQDRTALAVGSEEQVNSFTANTQQDASMAALYDTGGVQVGYVTVWSSYGQDRVQDPDYGVFGQIFDLNGDPVGGEFMVTLHTEFSQSDPSVVGLPTGGFAVSWTDNSGANPAGVADSEFSTGTYGRVFDVTGTPLGGDFLINDVTASTQRETDLAARANGNILAVFTDDGSRDGSGSGVFLREFSSTGVPQGAAVQVNTEFSSTQSDAKITVLANGTSVVTWTSTTSSTAGDGSGNGVFARIFDVNGAPVGGEFLVNTITNSNQDAPEIAALTDGGFVITWDDDSGVDGSSAAVMMQRYDSTGAPVGTSVLVNQYVNGGQFAPAVTALDTGGWVITWQNDNSADGSGNGVFAQVFAADGSFVDGEFQVNTEFSSTQGEPRIVSLPNGGYVITWTSATSGSAGDGSQNGVFQQVFGDSGVVADSAAPVVNGLTDVTFDEAAVNAGGQLLAPSVNLSDADSADFNGGVLGVTVLKNATVQPQFPDPDGTTQDQLGLDQSGPVTVVGTAVSVGGTQVGTMVSDGVDGAELRIALNANADVAAVRALLQALSYANTSNDPETARLVSVQLTDGDGGTFRQNVAITLTPETDGAVPVGSEVLTNSFTTNDQSDSHVAALANGGYVIVWTSRDQDATGDGNTGVFAQIYDGSGTPVGGELLINQTVQGGQSNAQVVGLATGGFVVAWEDSAPGGTFLRSFDGNGQPVGGEVEFDSPLIGNSFRPALAAIDDPVNGGFYLVEDGQMASTPFTNQIVVQRFNDAGGTVGGTMEIAPAGSSYNYGADVAVQANGTFMVVFIARNLDNPGDNDDGVFLQRYASDGSAIGAPIQVNTVSRFSQTAPRIAATEDGGYVVVYQSDLRDDFSHSNSPGVYGQRFDGAGVKVGPEFLINETVDGPQYQPDVAATVGGGFAVTFEDANATDGSGYGVYLQQYDANGNRIDGALQVNEEVQSTQYEPAIAALPNGNFVVSFSSFNSPPAGDGDAYGVFHRLLGDPADFSVGGEPVLDGINDQVTYDENDLNGVPQLIDADGAAAVSDPDSADFNGGSILVSNVIASAPLIDQINPPDDLTQDQLGLRQGPRISISGGTAVSVDGTQVATIVQNGQSGAPFELLLNGNADAAIVELLVENLTYRNTSDDPLPIRPLRIQITDGDGGSSDPVLVTVNITPTPDAAVPVGGERVVNTTNSGSEDDPAVASLPGTGGDFVVVFESSDASGIGIRAQRFDVLGNPVARDGTGLANGVTDEFQVNVTSTTGNQTDPKIAAFSDGSFVVVWADASIDGSLTGVAAQLFDSAGAPSGGVITVNSETTWNQFQPAVAVLDDDSFVVTWTSNSVGSSGDGSGDGIIARRFDATGAALGTPNTDFVVNTSTTGAQRDPDVTALNDGGFMILWEDTNGNDGSGEGVFAQRYDANGATVGTEFQINSTTSGNQSAPQVAVLDDGNIIATWVDNGADASGFGVYAQIYDTAGNPINNEFRVNDQRIGSQVDPAVAALDTGGFVIAWTDRNWTDGQQDGVYAQQYDAGGNRLDSQFLVNTTTAGNQNQPDIAPLPGGGFVITWNGSVMLQVYGNDAPTVSPIAASGDEDTAIVLDAAVFDAGFSDPNGNTLAEIRIDTFPTNGTLTLSGVPVTSGQIVPRADLLAGNLIYTGNQDFNGPDSFTWTGSDGLSFAAGSVLADITVNPVNDAPGLEAGPDTSLSEGQSLSRQLVLTDPDTDNRTFTVDYGDGTAAQVFGTSNLTPFIGHTYSAEGSYTVTVTVNDNSGALNAQETDSFIVDVVNANPNAVADFVNVSEDGPAQTGNLLTNDSDPGGDSFAIDQVNGAPGNVGAQFTLPSGALLTVSANGDFIYDPNGQFEALTDFQTGQDSFTYRINDGQGGTDQATVTVFINGQNDAPLAADDTLSVADDSTAVVNVLTNDSDADNNPLTIQGIAPPFSNPVSLPNGDEQVTLPSGAVVTFTPGTGAVSYDPAGNFSGGGSDSFDYIVADGRGGTDTGTVSVTITGTNGAPVAVDDGVSGTEDSTLSGNLLTNDSDPNGDTLTVSLVNGAPGNVGGQFALASGSLLTVGTDGAFSFIPNAQHQALQNGQSAVETFTYTIVDGSGGSDTATATMTITGVNDAPIAVGDTGATDEDTATGGNVLTNDTDVENDSLTVSEVGGSALAVGVATAGSAGGSFVINSDGSFTYDPTGALDSLAENTQTTDSITYRVSDGNGGNDVATLSIVVDGVNDAPDAVDDPLSTTEAAAITGLNLLTNDSDPDAGDVPFVVSVNGQTGAVGNQIALLSGALLTVNGSGTFTYDPNGQFNALQNGQTATESFTYTIEDGFGAQDTATATVTINGISSDPQAVDDTDSTDEDNATSFDVRLNDSDADGDPLTVTQVDGMAILQGAPVLLASGALVSLNANGTLSYDPNGQFEALAQGGSTTDSFTYLISDGTGGTATATVTMTITGVNDAPVAADDIRTTDEDSPVAISLFANNGQGIDTDPDAGFVLDTVLIDGQAPVLNTPITLASGATVTKLGNGLVSYDPAGQFNALRAGQQASDSFFYQISDGLGGFDTATVTVNITGVNDLPTAEDDDFAVAVDQLLSGNVLANNGNGADSDPDAGTVLAVNGVQGGIGLGAPVATANGGLVTLQSDGSFSYDQNGQFSGLGNGASASDSFTYQLTDGDGGTDTATVMITIGGSNLPPVAVDDSGSTDEDTATLLSVLSNDSDGNGDPLSITNIDTTGTLGTVTQNANGTLTYDPNGQFESLSVGQSATDSFVYTLSDGNGGSDTATVTVTVNGANDQPIGAADGGTGFVTDEDSAFTTANVLANDSDPDALDVLSVLSVTTAGTIGLVTDNGDGTFDYDPNGQFESLQAGDTTLDTFTYTLSDGQGGTDQVTVSITVQGVNDPPVAADDGGVGFTTDEDSVFATLSVLGNDSDPESDPLSVTAFDAVGTAGGLISHLGGGVFSYDPNGQFEALGAGQTAQDQFTYTIGDGNGGTDTATVTITVNGVNDAPVAVDDGGAGFATDEDTAFVTANVLTNDQDVDGGTLSVTGIDTTGTLGLVTDNGDGTFSYDPNGQFEALNTGQSATDSFDYLLSDGNGGTDRGTVTIDIAGVDEGKNVILGTPGRDNLVGTAADDAIYGMGGSLDVLGGGAGADCFDFAALIGNGARDATTITDYQTGLDSITGIDLNDIAQSRVLGSNLYLQLAGGENDLVVVLGVTDINDLTFA
ncbi:MAG: tandem-95 repeat protein [Rhodobacteraceae bacterium]|nr:tandem-95 repeat protein [Paracoccaceae bacterium]